jgi:hypothetical protein
MKEELKNEVVVGFDNEADQSEVVLENNEPDVVWEDVLNENELPDGWEDQLYENRRDRQFKEELEDESRKNTGTWVRPLDYWFTKKRHDYTDNMPRKARIDAPGALHHIIVRGIERRKVFYDDSDWDNFLERLGGVLTETGTPCFA